MNDYTVEQVWAEALECWKAGEELFLAGDIAKEALEQQKLAMENDERLGLIREYLDRLLPENWEEMSLSERRQFIHGTEFGSSEGTMERDRVCAAEVWCELFCKDLASAKKFELEEIHGLMRQIDGWERYQGSKEGRLRFKLYGLQRAYVRTKNGNY